MRTRPVVASLLCSALVVAALLSGGSTRDPVGDPAPGAMPTGSPNPAGFVPAPAGDEVDALVAWALGRFDRQGLPRPDVAAVVAIAQNGCSGRRGWVSFEDDEAVVALCEDLEVSCPGFRGVATLTDEAKRCLLHELAHVWIHDNVGADRRNEFMAHTGAAAWDDPHLPWHARGTEQAAETLAWGLRCEPTVAPSGTTAACLRRAAGFEILAGRSPTVDCGLCAPPPMIPRP